MYNIRDRKRLRLHKGDRVVFLDRVATGEIVDTDGHWATVKLDKGGNRSELVDIPIEFIIRKETNV